MTPLRAAVQAATRNPDLAGEFRFPDEESRRRFRRRLEDALRKTASDWDLVLIADILGVRIE